MSPWFHNLRYAHVFILLKREWPRKNFLDIGKQFLEQKFLYISQTKFICRSSGFFLIYQKVSRLNWNADQTLFDKVCIWCVPSRNTLGHTDHEKWQFFDRVKTAHAIPSTEEEIKKEHTIISGLDFGCSWYADAAFF